MSESIKAGDLVQIVHQCCGAQSELGEIFFVGEIVHTWMGCDRCGYDATGLGAVDQKYDDGHAIPLSWLKRIPPLGELEGEKRDEKLTEPA